METLTLFGVSLPLLPLLLLSSWLLLSLMNKLKRPAVTGFSDALLVRLLLSLLLARLVFILQHLSVYQADWWQLLDIRDRGFDGHSFLLFVSLLLLQYGYQQRQARALLWLGLPLVLGWVAGSFALYRHYYPLPTGAPAYSFQTLSGEKQQLSTLLAQRKAAFTVVNLWASWCPPCRAEMPLLQQSQADYPQGQFILLNQGETAAEVAQFLQQHQLQFQQVWLDPNRQFGRWLGQQALPLTLIYDQQGKLVDGHAGLLSKAMLAAKLAPLQRSAEPE